MDHFTLAKENMVKGQILPNKITDKAIIKSFLEVPRHSFVPDSFKAVCYADECLYLSDDRYMTPPMVLAKMLQSLGVNKGDSVLDVACGIGYSSAILSILAKKVVAIESDSDLASKANLALNKMDIGNVVILNNKLADGHIEGGPYDVILVNGALSGVPMSLTSQLSEGGRMAVVIGNEAILFKKEDEGVRKEVIFESDFPLISDF